MLHEILLSLSGVPSPLWQQVRNGNGTIKHYVTPPETTILTRLSEIADLHLKIRDAAQKTSDTHPSTICCAISNRIRTYHLRLFQDHVVHVEASILSNDAKFVGAYKTVPLSTVFTEFQPWLQRLRWLWNVIVQMQNDSGPSRQATSGASGKSMMSYLDWESHTGYTAIKEMSLDLLVTAQQSWMHTMMPWLMYGQLPANSKEDFMIAATSRESRPSYALRPALQPDFVNADTAEAILAIGVAFNQLASQNALALGPNSPRRACTTILPSTLASVQALKFPLHPTTLQTTVDKINETISEVALTQLLPSKLILEFLQIAQQYLLIENGEFAISLIQHLDQGLAAHLSKVNVIQPVRKLGQLKDLSVGETELATALQKTWSELAVYQSSYNIDHDVFDKAAELVHLTHTTEQEVSLSTLLPIPVVLTIQLQTDSPLSMFISKADLQTYASISSYLLSLRRGEYQVSTLWRRTSHRRCHPAPLGPPASTTRYGRQALLARRAREERRLKRMRIHWSNISRARSILVELGSYLHGDVIEKGWERLETWLRSKLSESRPASSSASRPTTASSQPPSSQRLDPRRIARAHRKYLHALQAGLLILSKPYLTALHDLLRLLDHYVALFGRLETIWQGLDLQEDEGVMDAFSNYAQEESEIYEELGRSSVLLQKSNTDVVESLKETEKQRGIADLVTGTEGLGVVDREDEFVPWKGRNLDRLLMKLEYMSGNGDEATEALVVD